MNLTRTARRRRVSLTPMIDVVFLLLVFFMLAARFGTESTVSLAIGGTGAVYEGPPRLVDLTPSAVRLNGVAVAEEALAAELARLMDGPDDTVALRARDGAEVQRLVDVMDLLRAAGLTSLALVE